MKRLSRIVIDYFPDKSLNVTVDNVDGLSYRLLHAGFDKAQVVYRETIARRRQEIEKEARERVTADDAAEVKRLKAIDKKEDARLKKAAEGAEARHQKIADKLAEADKEVMA